MSFLWLERTSLKNNGVFVLNAEAELHRYRKHGNFETLLQGIWSVLFLLLELICSTAGRDKFSPSVTEDIKVVG